MSDTLQEREDEMSDDGSKEWCDDCHGYTHMPWCPAYEPAVDDRELYMQPPTNEHQPAARGGGDGWSYNFSDGEYHIREQGNGDCIAHTKYLPSAKRIIDDHNQHQSLVAEREQLRQVIRDEITAIRIWQHAIHPRSDVQEGLAISLLKLESALNQQRSTSE